MQKLIKSKSFCFKQPATKTCVSKIKELLETKKKKTKQKKKRRSYAQTSSSLKSFSFFLVPVSLKLFCLPIDKLNYCYLS